MRQYPLETHQINHYKLYFRCRCRFNRVFKAERVYTCIENIYLIWRSAYITRSTWNVFHVLWAILVLYALFIFYSFFFCLSIVRISNEYFNINLCWILLGNYMINGCWKISNINYIINRVFYRLKIQKHRVFWKPVLEND